MFDAAALEQLQQRLVKAVCAHDAGFFQRLAQLVHRAGVHPVRDDPDDGGVAGEQGVQGVLGRGADVVDVNLGCPMPRVVRKGVGAAMLKDPVLLHRVLSEMRREVPGLLSAKIRAGFDESANVVAIAKTVEDAGVDFEWHEFNAAHAFLRDEGVRYNPALARVAMALLLRFLAEKIG